MAGHTRDWEFVADGADTAARIAASDGDAMVWVPHDAPLRIMIQTDEFEEGAATADHVQWPLWALHAAHAAVFVNGGVDVFASDAIPLPQQLGNTQKDAVTTGFFENGDNSYTSLALYALALGQHAAAQRAAGNTAPYTLEAEGVHDLRGPYLQPAHPAAVLNSLSAADLLLAPTTIAPVRLSPFFMLSWLLYPRTPAPNYDEDASGTEVVVMILQAAKIAFPALNAVSERRAMAALLAVPLPPQLVRCSTDLAARAEYVSLLGAWANETRRPGLLQSHFVHVLQAEASLRQWVGQTVGPFQEALRLMKILKCDVPIASLEVEAFSILNGRLEQCGDYWSDERTAQDNLSYLAQALGASSARGAGDAGAGTEAGGDALAPRLGAPGDKEMSDLVVSLQDWAQETSPNDFDAIELIYKSQVGRAIRWLLGKVESKRLPPIFETSCTRLPAKLDEYVIDALKRDDDGKHDADLEDLTVGTLLASGTTHDARRTFFADLLANRFASIDWEKQLVGRIMRLVNPADGEWTMERAYADSDRMKLHVRFIGRALAAVGKPPEVDNSYAAMVAEWDKAMSQAKACGDAMKEDTLAQVVKLMAGLWANAHTLGVTSLKAALYEQALFDPNAFSELQAFRSFADDLPRMKRLTTRFVRSFSALAVGVGGGTIGGGTAVTTTTTPITPAAPAPGESYGRPASRVDRFHEADGFTFHTERARVGYHVANCQRVAKEKFGVHGLCVMACMAEGLPAGQELKASLAYCGANHAPRAPEHSLAIASKRRELMKALVDAGDCVKDRFGTPGDGGERGKRQKERGPFRRQTAPRR